MNTNILEDYITKLLETKIGAQKELVDQKQWNDLFAQLMRVFDTTTANIIATTASQNKDLFAEVEMDLDNGADIAKILEKVKSHYPEIEQKLAEAYKLLGDNYLNMGLDKE